MSLQANYWWEILPRREKTLQVLQYRCEYYGSSSSSSSLLLSSTSQATIIKKRTMVGMNVFYLLARIKLRAHVYVTGLPRRLSGLPRDSVFQLR